MSDSLFTESHSKEQSEIEYRTLEQFDGYRFGSDGSIWSCWKKVGLPNRRGTKSIKVNEFHQLTPMGNEDGYLFVNIRQTSGTIKRNVLVHQLILLAFGFHRPSTSHQVCHQDGCRTNNQLANLRWGTSKDNAQDSIRHGTFAKDNNKRLTSQDKEAISQLRLAGKTISQIKKLLGFSKKTIQRVLRTNNRDY